MPDEGQRKTLDFAIPLPYASIVDFAKQIWDG